ncbi:Telomere length regulation protein elg1 [Psilocybe cubensis]|uniref:Telomere length regulation protein elg1 n=2 Tax=Psilocybe cubensis TaxID=181762 RepID=A0ACB8H5A1_PSICU|nr:Telomere length regulation protein elg1 [Psilocybe cubensis]KAH9482666.1 Telomere length regulation protein elg1 [Psilocybe cubensis]
MSTDRKKLAGVAKASGSKNKTTLKQKSLLESFVVKSNKNDKAGGNNQLSVPPPDLLPTEVDGPATPSVDNSILPLELDDTIVPLLDVTIPDVELEARPTQILDLTTPDVELDESGTVVQVVDATRRSPSIVLLEEDAAIQVSQAVSSQTSKSKAKVEGYTRDQPIVIPSSPIKESTNPKPNVPVHPFFMSKAKPTASSTPLPTKTSKNALPNQGPPFPNSESQHVKGPQTATQTYVASFPNRSRTIPSQMTLGMTNYKFLIGRPDIVVDKASDIWIHPKADTPNEPSILDIPPEHIHNHPAIARLVENGPDCLPTSSRPWSEKWRPSCAKEVLGNENSAIYLRNWLRALELQLESDHDNSAKFGEGSNTMKGKSKANAGRGTKRVRVVRTVDKSRKKSRLDSDEEDDDWIVYDDESEEEQVNFEELDEFGEILLPEVPASSSQSSSTHDLPPSFVECTEQDLGQLHNTILLSGPSGSGKTASVYACSEELGWDVFEVYPGVGRRNGANVDNLVGEVGKNHLVLQNRRNGDVLKSFLSQKKNTEAPQESLVASYSPRKRRTDKDPFDVEEPVNDSKPIRQSLILLEEVDILYKEDINFWTTVIRIIKECKRPVICTCNDPTLVPTQDLPLQTIIEFEPCPTDVAASYLQAVCLSEGYQVDRNLISRMYLYPLEGDRTGLYSASCRTAGRDLRRTINALQIKCGRFTRATANEERDRSKDGPGVVRRMAFGEKSEFLSFLDAELVRDSSGIATGAELASYVPTNDDETGHTILYDRQRADREDFGQHEDIICCAVESGQKVHGDDVPEEAREDGEVLRVLEEVRPVRAWTRRLALEYLPYVRWMVVLDEAEEERIRLQGQGQGMRKTRNSGRSDYVRRMALSETGRRIVVSTGLGIVDGA